MARRATWILLLALILAPILGNTAAHSAFAQDGESSAAVTEEATPSADDEATDDQATPDATEPAEPSETVEATETPGEETPAATPTDEASPTVEPSETPVETATPAETATEVPATPEAEVEAAGQVPVVTIDEIVVTINCTSEPERVRVTNTGDAAVTVISIGSIFAPLSAEPIAVGKSVPANGTRQWLAGSTATGSWVLIDRLILTNSAYEAEGVVVETSVGSVEVRCPPKPALPPVTKDQVAVSINCTSDPEKIRVTNLGKSTLTVNSITTLYNPQSPEPIAVNAAIAAGGSRLWQAGEGAKGSYVLTKKYILTNTAYDDEGVKIVTSAGTITVRCPEAPPDPYGGAKWIEVNLSSQYLIAWQNGVRVAESYTSTGRPGFDTPTGTWYINSKLTSQTMSGCIQGECYYVPNVPWVMYFTDWGHAIHGAYWHNNFGNVMSHGCVNLPVSFAEWLWYWTPYGTPVVVHY